MATAMSSGPAAQPQAPDRARGAAPYVEFEGIEKSYDGRTLVVRDLDLSVREGEFLTLLGPSGSGKTTCLMMLAGFETPTSGTIRIAGRSVHDLPPRQRNIGVVFQNYALFPHLTVEKNLSFPLDVRRLAPEQRRERVRRALQLVRLEGFERRRPDELSGGQQQRVAIARALVFEPSLVLMDEPLGALDRSLREEMQYEIRRIHRRRAFTSPMAGDGDVGPHRRVSPRRSRWRRRRSSTRSRNGRSWRASSAATTCCAGGWRRSPTTTAGSTSPDASWWPIGWPRARRATR